MRPFWAIDGKGAGWGFPTIKAGPRSPPSFPAFPPLLSSLSPLPPLLSSLPPSFPPLPSPPPLPPSPPSCSHFYHMAAAGRRHLNLTVCLQCTGSVVYTST